MISNWSNYHMPFEPIDNFTRHEPFPSNEVKSTYVSEKRKRKPTGAQAADALARAQPPMGRSIPMPPGAKTTRMIGGNLYSWGR